MALRIKTWLLVGVVAALGNACAKGIGSGREASPSPATNDEDAAQEEVVEEDADVPEEEDAGGPSRSDAAMDAGPAKDAGATDAGPKDASAPEAALDAGVDAGPALDAAMSMPDSGRPPPAPLPTGMLYDGWTYVEVEGARCRDGSKAGYYHRRGDDNLMIFLNGSGACTDPYFCGLIPKNVNESFVQESLLEAAFPVQERQRPLEQGILRRDSRNPVASWSMVFVPYCTGDVHAGSKPDATVPDVAGKQQFVGYTNVGLFLNSFGPSFPDTQKVLLAGSGAGGFGALLNVERVQDFFAPQGAKVTVVSDSGIPFQDMFLEPCLQKKWRDLWNLNAVLPQACTGCRNADGGGLALGLGTYLFKERFKDRMMGGMISTSQDEIIRLFFSAGLNMCTVKPADEALPMLLGGGSYPRTRFPMGLRDVINTVIGADRVAYYVIEGSTHMHLWRNRFYEQNGVGGSMADWLADVLMGKPTHRGNL